jgi:hypothetical protein
LIVGPARSEPTARLWTFVRAASRFKSRLGKPDSAESLFLMKIFNTSASTSGASKMARHAPNSMGGTMLRVLTLSRLESTHDGGA